MLFNDTKPELNSLWSCQIVWLDYITILHMLWPALKEQLGSDFAIKKTIYL